MKEENPILDKSFEFSVRVVNLYKFLTSQKQEFVMSKQMLRCGTSIGANVSEAVQGFSYADFSAKMSIALKEACEAEYWIRLLYRTDFLENEHYQSIVADCQELIRLLTAILKKAKNKINT